MLKGLTLRDWGIREAGTKVGMRVAEWSYSGKAEEETKKKKARLTGIGRRRDQEAQQRLPLKVRRVVVVSDLDVHARAACTHKSD